jgi:hypothetical protein
MLTQDKITEIYCIADDFCKEYAKEKLKRQIYLVKVKSAGIVPARCLTVK